MNAEDGWAGRVMVCLRIVSNLIVVNLLVLAGSLVGLIVLGAMPALRAATACLTCLRDGDADRDPGLSGRGLVRTFVTEYRRAFWRANLLGAPFAVALLLAAADTAVLPALPGPASAAVAVLTWIVGAYAVIALAAVFAIDVRYQDSIGATIRYAAVLPFVSPVMVGALLLALGAMAFALVTLPMLVPLIGASVPLFVAGWFVDHRLAGLDPGHPRAAALTH